MGFKSFMDNMSEQLASKRQRPQSNLALLKRAAESRRKGTQVAPAHIAVKRARLPLRVETNQTPNKVLRNDQEE